ncbi:LPP20 family lipoprotein [Marinomonas balearica]|uniref:LPP20 lipoprotein n=1 Tax=Marinomonas balearica TaxID=491947 RepID=A0A4R6M920_9GAMM|nr:LPP20 family lipoprotein [Marinomonas balearica]TDO97913.1 LPP20 lipoprotein [Marinomonas balearica]
MRISSTFFRHNRLILGVCLSGLLTACVGSGGDTASQSNAVATMPEWISNPPKDARYLYGVGSYSKIEDLAEAYKQAEQNGNAQIAQQLRTQVSQVNTQDIQVTQETGQQEHVLKAQSAYTKSKSVNIELDQIQNQARFQDDQYVYALQAFDRSKAASRLRQKIDKLDGSIRAIGAKLALDLEPNPKDWRAYLSLIPLFSERQLQVQKLELYSKSGAIFPPDSKVKAIQQALGVALKSFAFKVDSDALFNPVSSQLTEVGLRAGTDNVVWLLSTTTQSRSENKAGRTYTFTEGTLNLSTSSGEPLGSWTAKGRGISKQEASAILKAQQDWSEKAVSAMFQWMTGS